MVYYKFYSWGKYRKDILCNLVNNRIFVQSIRYFNDPFEGRWFGCEPESQIHAAHKSFLDRLERCGIYSLCASKTDDFICSSKSVLMWSHYASSHTGFCVEFNENLLSDTSQFEFAPRCIRYEKSMPDKRSTIDYDELSYIHYCSGKVTNGNTRMSLDYVIRIIINDTSLFQMGV